MSKPSKPPFLDRPYGRRESFVAGRNPVSAKPRKWQQPEEIISTPSEREKQASEDFLKRVLEESYQPPHRRKP